MQRSWSHSIFLLTLFLLFFFQITNAQIQVRDINSSSSSSPGDVVELNNILYFSANDGSTGEELWRSDGTRTGTYIVKDIRTGSVGSAIDDMVVMNGKLYFSANDGVNGTELWTSDGTTVGTVLLKDIYTGSTASSPDEIVVHNNMLYFAATSSSAGKELWKSDGTTVGTVLVKDINPGSSAHSYPANIFGFGSEIYFKATNGSNGNELWKSDGTSGGTVEVQDIYAGGIGSDPDEFAEFGGNLYFAARDASNHRELWTVNGGTGVLSLVSDINSGSSGSYPQQFFEYNSELYFVATTAANGQEIWKTDGTAVGTVLAVDYRPGVNSSYPNNFVVMGGHFYFVATRYNSHGYELHKSDGTYGGTAFVKNINPTSSGDAGITSIVLYKDRLFFDATDDTHGREMWMSDGTSDGTVMLRDINDDGSSPGPSSDPSNFIIVNDILFFSANNSTTSDFELMQVGNCELSEVPLATAEGVFNSFYEKTDGGGWTHYCDCQNNLLVSLEKGSSGAVISKDSVSVKIGATTVSYYDDSCGCFITNSAGAVVFNRSWDVRPDVQPSSEVGVRFYFTDAEYLAINAELTTQGKLPLTDVDEMSFFKVTNSSLGSHPEIVNIDVGDALVLLNGTASTSQWASGDFNSDHYAEYQVTSFSGGGGGGGSGGSPLPVELLSFKARPQGEHVYMEWITASELNNAGFFIERSKDGASWETIDFVEGMGDGNAPNIYEYVDKNPYSGTSYYRLLQRDLDGAEAYSNIAQVSMEVLILGEPSPNPVLEQGSVFVDIQLERDQNVEVLLIDGNGSVVKRERMFLENGVQRMEIDCSNLTRGLYHLRLMINKEAYHRTFVIESTR